MDNNWEFRIICKDCGIIIRVPWDDWSKDLTPGGDRIVLLRIPQLCPSCQNLKLVNP